MERALDNLHCDELILLAWVRNALMVLSVLKWQLLVVEVLLLVDKVVDVLLTSHVLRANSLNGGILMHHTLVGEKGAKHVRLLDLHAAQSRFAAFRLYSFTCS